MIPLVIQKEARRWIAENCPPAIRQGKKFQPYIEAPKPHQIDYLLEQYYNSDSLEIDEQENSINPKDSKT